MYQLVAAFLFAVVHCAHAQTFTDGALVVSDYFGPGGSLSQPIALRFTGANEGFLIEKTGAVKRFQNGSVTTVLNIPVATNSERGLLGMALAPGFSQNDGRIYLYYSAGSGSTWTENRLARYTWNGTTLAGPTTLATFGTAGDGQNSGPNHNGGPLLYGADGKLYGATGDLNRSGIEQNQSATTSARTGGVFRLNPDGTAPLDNPFASNANADVRRWYTYGVRNSFGLAVDPATGRLWNTENGPDAYDEINLLSAGMNSGWNPVMGPDGRDPQSVADLALLPGAAYQDPKFSFVDPIGITALQFAHGSSWGTQYDDAVLVGEVNGGRIWLFRLNAARDGFVLAGDVADAVLDPNDAFSPFGTGFGIVSDITQGPDGALYITSLTGNAVYRVAPVPEPQAGLLTAAGLALIALAHVRRRRAARR